MNINYTAITARAADKPLFTPGPLTTSRTVKQAMLRDLGSRDSEFINVVREIREGLLKIAGVQAGEYEAIPMQGSGTFAIEAVFATCVPRDASVLVVVNGAYGQRMIQILTTLGIECVVIEGSENAPPDIAAVERTLETNPGVGMVAVVHCETTTGIVNPIDKIGAAVKAAGKTYFVDAMSSFGAIPIDFTACHIDYLVSSANKCIEGVPGFAFAIARKDTLLAAEGNARSISLDLIAQWRGLEKNGQFRFTPPTHALLAFHQALHELDAEGGVNGRATRYRRNHEVLVEGMRALGFREYLAPDLQGYIITSFRYPRDPNFDFERFYSELSDRGYVIYPGKVSDADCFRIGHIGRVFESDTRDLVNAIREVLEAKNVTIGKDG